MGARWLSGIAAGADAGRGVKSTTDWRRVHDFWFPIGLDKADLETHRSMTERWFHGGLNRDLIGFAGLVGAAGRGELDDWRTAPYGRLSLIIVLDQFPRGLYAGTPQAFAFDSEALAVTEEGLKNGHYDSLMHPWERAFFALPLIHAEGPGHLERAERSVALAETRLSDGPPHLRPLREFWLSQARGHRDVIARFGRHPHRNAALGRASTPEEAAYVERGDFVHHRRPT